MLTQGLSGKVSGLVFRHNANGSVSVGDAPRPSSKPPTAKALAKRQRFHQAAFYGKAAKKTPPSTPPTKRASTPTCNRPTPWP